MKQEITATGKTIDSAVEKGAASLGVSVSDVTYEVISEPKKGFLGIGEQPAKVKVIYERQPADLALDFVKTMIDNMELDAAAEIENKEDSAVIRINGGDSAVLIGHHGETLDQLQYLVNLVANKRDSDEEDGEHNNYFKISVDVEDYRAKREQTLRTLARRMAMKVKKYKKNVALEPMSAYERRIIHSEIQGIEGVTTSSVGQENNRRVVIIYQGEQ